MHKCAQAADAQLLCTWVLHLLQQYAAHNAGRVSLAAASRLRADAAEESYRCATGSLSPSHCVVTLHHAPRVVSPLFPCLPYAAWSQG